MLQLMGFQRVGHGLAKATATTDLFSFYLFFFFFLSFHFNSLSFFRSKSITALLKMYWDFYISSYKPSL